MQYIKVGDIVSRKSYGNDILFKVAEILDNEQVLLKGIVYRLEADAPQSDLGLEFHR